MSDLKARLLIFVSVASCICITAWLAGYDFNERGDTAAWLFATTLTLSAAAATFPFDKQESSDD